MDSIKISGFVVLQTLVVNSLCVCQKEIKFKSVLY